MAACSVHCFIAAAIARQPRYRGHPGGWLRLLTTLSMHAVTLLLPLAINTVRIIYGAPDAAAPLEAAPLPAPSGLVALAAAAARTAHAVVVFGLAVCWLQTMSMAALGWPQTPAVHLALQSTKAALLMHQARAGEDERRSARLAQWVVAAAAAAAQHAALCRPACSQQRQRRPALL